MDHPDFIVKFNWFENGCNLPGYAKNKFHQHASSIGEPLALASF